MSEPISTTLYHSAVTHLVRFPFVVLDSQSGEELAWCKSLKSADLIVKALTVEAVTATN